MNAEDETTDLDRALASLFDDGADAGGADEVTDLGSLLDGPLPLELSSGRLDDREGELVAVRSAATIDERQVVIKGGWVDVVIDVRTDDDGRLSVRGTVLGIEEVCAVQLLDGVVEVGLAVTDQFGEFDLAGVSAGRYHLVVAARRAELTTEVELS